MKELNFDAIVVGSGAAGYAAACRLAEAGVRTAIVTENKNAGTSRNAGSDKQTYYKLSLAGEMPDSIGEMAADLFAGGAVDGDVALCEAALSAPCFLKLCSLGVGFPVNEYGEYPGYITDHDTRGRATSAGPLTSKMMTEALEKRAYELNIPVLDGYVALKVLKSDGHVSGLICYDAGAGEYSLIRCGYIILATGGPAGIYADSVYPESQHGAASLALEAGASLRNMTEWQYGLASVAPRWNVSGTYMQVLPRFVSVDENGVEREFLKEHFATSAEAASMVFFKGYQWPFDSSRIEVSSRIDLLVYRETVLLGRRVYLDYTENPSGLENGFEALSDEAYDYLNRNGACFGKPIDRLWHMNAPAVEFYRSKGVDLGAERLEIRLCAQHNNGGIEVDVNWQTSVPGLFAAGEAAGTHGIKRPGGSALNAGQAGAARAAAYITKALKRGEKRLDHEDKEQTDGFYSLIKAAESIPAEELARTSEELRIAMSGVAGPVRQLAGMKKLYEKLTKTEERLRSFRTEGTAVKTGAGVKPSVEPVCVRNSGEQAGVDRAGGIACLEFFKLIDELTTARAVLLSMIDYAEHTGSSRGSALYTYDGSDGIIPGIGSVAVDSRAAFDRIQSVSLSCSESGSGELETAWKPVRPIPSRDEPFEAVWRRFREEF